MKKILFISLISMQAIISYAQHYATRVVKDNLFIPWEIIYGPDDHIWLTQKNGYVCRPDPANGHMDTLLHQKDSEVMGRGEGGMLGLALHPDFADTPYVYFAYEYFKGAEYLERIIRYTYKPDTLTDPLVLLDGIKGAVIHNGARLLIADRKLYITTGEANEPAKAQDLTSLNGKTLRINLDGSIPADNPIPGSPVWNWGQRNAQGLVDVHGRLYSSMHGASTDDEINILLKGRNYGWPAVEGYCDKSTEMAFCADSNVVEPVLTWTPTVAPSGMDYYQHPMFPDLANSLIVTTLKSEALYQLRLNATYDSVIDAAVIATPGISGIRLRDVCISPRGSIFVSTSQWGGDVIFELYDPAATSLIESDSTVKVNVLPNPVKDKVDIHIDITEPGRIRYELTAIDGRVVRQGSFDTGKLTLDMSCLMPGIYLFHSYAGPGVQVPVQKIVKE